MSMVKQMRMVKVSTRNHERIKKYGFFGESMDTALGRALDAADRDKTR